MATQTEKPKGNFPLAGLATDGWSTEDEATATCFCGAVQISFLTKSPGLIDTFICNCTDCHKITASMFASNFTVIDPYLKHIRGKDNLKAFAQKKTTVSGETMTNYFCSTCGTLMYRCSSMLPGQYIARIGTVDDFNVQETLLRPRREQFIKDRHSWLKGFDGVEKADGAGQFGKPVSEGGIEYNV